jgi:RHS repeat-associated protein
VLLSRGKRAALTLSFLASVCLALAGFGAPAEGSYEVLRGGGGPNLVTLDPEGNRTSTTTPKGQLTTTLHDELGKPLDLTQPPPKEGEQALVTRFRYDENRNLVEMQDADNRVTKLEYDELNRLFRTTRDPGGLALVSETTDFDEDGRPLRIAEANGEATVQTWDELGRLESRMHEPPATGWTAPWQYTSEERYSYDPNSNLERVEEYDVRSGGGTPPVRVTTRGYDKLDRQTSETVTLQDGSTKAVTTEYWRNGQVKSVTDAQGATSYTYDGQGREETVTTSAGITRKTYYPDDLVKDITFPNLTKRAHGYDKADRLLSIVTTKDAAAVASTAYTYDPNGNRLNQVQTNGGVEETTTYTYDDLDRLATVTYSADAEHPNGRTVTYGHDGAGNRLTEVVTDPQTEAVLESRTGVFDRANRLTELTDNLDAAQTTTLAWDRNGNLLSETKAGVTTSYRYDLRDTLAEVERGGQTLARFLGDFDERRVLKIGDPTRPGGSGVQEYVYNGSRLVLDVENGQPTARYEWTNEELVSLLQSGGARRYFALDGLETVLALTDESGQAIDRLNFDARGVPKEGTDFGTSGSRFAFTSHRFDTELNLYYAGGRMYSPTIGRFISQDTLSLDPNNPDSWNLFAYARSNPTRFVDPDGHIARQMLDESINKSTDNASNWFTAGAKAFFKEAGYQTLDVISFGALHRQDELVDQNLRGEISDSEYYAKTGANVAISGTQAALTLSTGGAMGATPAAAVAWGAAGGIAGQGISDLGEIYGTETKTLDQVRARDYLLGGAMGAVGGYAGYKARAPGKAGPSQAEKTGVIAEQGQSIRPEAPAPAAGAAATADVNVQSAIKPAAQVPPSAASSGTSARHAAWGQDLDAINASVERLGRRALKQSGGDWQKSEALFERYLGAVEKRLGRTGSQYGVEIQPAALPGGQRVPSHIYLEKLDGSGLVHDRWGNLKQVPYPGSRRMDAAIIDRMSPGPYHRAVSGFDISLNAKKPSVSAYYEEAFPFMQDFFDIRLRGGKR